METAEKLFEKAKRLNKEDLSRLVALLDEYLSSEIDAKYSPKKHHVGLLALSGIADSDFTDVSSHKARHLAHAYATRRGD